jgi:hypothetical protein
MLAEGFPFEPAYPALHEIEVVKKRQFLPLGRRCGEEIACCWRERQRDPASFPVASRLARQMLWIPHGVLLGDRRDMDGIVEAIEKIRRHAGELVSAERGCP